MDETMIVERTENSWSEQQKEVHHLNFSLNFLHYSWTLIENSDELFAKVKYVQLKSSSTFHSTRCAFHLLLIVTLIYANASFICLYSIIDCLAANRGLCTSIGDESRWAKIMSDQNRLSDACLFTVSGIDIHMITPITCICCIFYTCVGGKRILSKWIKIHVREVK